MEAAYQAWAAGPARQAHARGPADAGSGSDQPKPVSTGATLLEFEVVQQAAPKAP